MTAPLRSSKACTVCPNARNGAGLSWHGVVELRYRFVRDGELIAELVIAP